MNAPASPRAAALPALVVLLLVAPPAARSGTVDDAGAAAPATAAAPLPGRTDDHVVVTGAHLGGAVGLALDSLALLAFRDGAWQAVPFQIDERKADGNFAFPEGLEASHDETPGLDGNDELAFMATDVGTRAGGGPPGAGSTFELEVRDPVTGDVGYVYLASDADGASPLPRSDRRYVHLDAATDSIRSPRWQLTFSRKIPFSWAYATLRGPDGEFGPNLVDRNKVRATAIILFGLMEWSIDEESMRSLPTGYLAGPVRVVRRVVSEIEFGLGVKSPELIIDMTFYRDSMHVPSQLYLPVEPGLFVSDLVAQVILDLRDLRGWTMYTNEQPAGVEIDGVMAPAERALGDEEVEWLAFVSDRGHGLLSRAILSEGLRSLRKTVYYVDDPTALAPPEDHPGQGPAVGFTFSHFDEIQAGTHPIEIELYLVDGYEPGDEARILRNAGTPPVVTARPLP